MTIAQPRGRLAGREIDSRLVREKRRCRIEHSDVDALAFARPLAREQRHRNTLLGKHPAHNVRYRDSQADSLAFGGSRDAHEPALRLRHRVVACFLSPGTRLSEARDAAVDKARIAIADLLVAEA